MRVSPQQGTGGLLKQKVTGLLSLTLMMNGCPNILKQLHHYQSTWPECSVFATSYFLQDIKNQRNVIKLKKMPFTADRGLLTNYFEVASSSHPPLWTSAVVVKKEAILSVGGFPEGIKSGEDLLTWARLGSYF